MASSAGLSVLLLFSYAAATAEAKSSAIDQARLCAGGTIQVPAGTYDVPAGLIVTSPLWIQGAGAGQTILRATAGSRLFLAEANLTLSGLTLEGGAADTHGGAVAADTDARVQLTITHSVLTGNSAVDGGAVALAALGAHFPDPCETATSSTTASTSTQPVNSHAPSTLSVDATTFSGNSAASTGAGGGVYLGGGTGVVSDSTFDHDSAGKGGAVFTQGPSLQLRNDTLYANTASSGGAVAAFAGDSLLQNVTFDRNASAAGKDVAVLGSAVVRPVNSIFASGAAACLGSLQSLGHNLDAATSCHLGGAHDLAAGTAGLGTPAANGGETLTEALLAGSSALDAADASNCPGTDQRGVLRPANEPCDLGAFESSLDPPAPVPSPTPVPSPAAHGAVEGVTVGLPNTGAQPASRTATRSPAPALAAVAALGFLGFAIAVFRRRRTSEV